MRTMLFFTIASLLFGCLSEEPELTQPRIQLETRADVGLRPAPSSESPKICQKHTLESGQTMGHLIGHLNLTPSLQRKLVSALEPHLPSRRIRPGLALTACHIHGALSEIRFTKPKATSFLSVTLETSEQWRVTEEAIPMTTRTELIQMTIRHSIGQAVEDAGAQASLTPLLAEVLAWDMDLRRDVQKGDRINVLVDQLHRSSGAFLKYDRIIALSYRGKNRQLSIFGFQSKGDQMRYYDEAGGDSPPVSVFGHNKEDFIHSSFGVEGGERRSAQSRPVISDPWSNSTSSEVLC